MWWWLTKYISFLVPFSQDYPKLRELHQARLRLSWGASNASSGLQWKTSLNSTLGGVGTGGFPLQQQQRSLFGLAAGVTSTFQNLHLKSLETSANNRPSDPQAQYEFLAKLIQAHPHAVVERVGSPMFRHMAVDGRIAMLYFQALQQTNRYDQFHMEDIIARLHDSQAVAPGALSEYLEESRKLTKAKQVAGLQAALSGGGSIMMGGMSGAGGSSGGALPSRGMDPKFPLHVQLHNPTSTRAAILTLTGRVLIAFVVVSALSAMLDEKGVGRGLGMNNGSKHVQTAENNTNVTFDDVKGVSEAKAELEEIVMYLKNPSKFTRLGGQLPRGLLLTGPPGTGKTLLAKAIAGEADVPFFFSSGSQFEEVYVGLGAKRIRELFEAAKKKSPCIIFIDEIDAVGGTRKLKDQSALKMTLNELLVQMDGFEQNNGVIVIGATNFVESLDAALLRPGRFDKHVVVPLPDVGGRKEILELYAKKTKLHPNVDLNVVARGTTGFSGADLYNLMNQAALKASVDGLSSITMTVIEYAKDKIMMGAERKTAVITKETAKCTAYHEAGHALVAVMTDGAMPSKLKSMKPEQCILGGMNSSRPTIHASVQYNLHAVRFD
jgi:ATP-dependent metalloprotease